MITVLNASHFISRYHHLSEFWRIMKLTYSH